MRIFNIDITRKGISPVVQVTEHDAMSRFFTLILRNGNADYEPPENPSYSVWYKTKDSTGWYDTIEEPDNGTHPAVVASGNMFTIEIAEAATTSCGELALMITGDDGYQLTVTGIITQSADIPGYDSSEVENYYNVYITRMQENAARAENAAATAIEYGATVEVDETAQQLIITHTDNTEDVQTWVTEAEAWAVGQRNGEDVPSTDETYHNNAKYYAQAAAQSAASLTVDTELSSTSTNPVQNKVIDATVTELKNEIDVLNLDLVFTNNASIATPSSGTINPVPVVSQSYKCLIVPCSAGDNFSISVSSGSSVRGWCFTDAGYNVITRGDPETIITTVLTAASEGYLVLNSKIEYASAYAYKVSGKIEDIDQKIASMLNDIDALEEPITTSHIADNAVVPAKTSFFVQTSHNLINPDNIDTGLYYSPSADQIKTASSGTANALTGLIEVDEGETYTFSGTAATPYGGYFGASAEAVSGQSSIADVTVFDPVTGSGKCFTVPTGQNIKYVAFNLVKDTTTGLVSGTYQIEKGEMATEIVPYELVYQIDEQYLPGTGGSSGNFSQIDTLPRPSYEFEKSKIENFIAHCIDKDKDVMVVGTGTSLTARSSEHCTVRQDATSRPPLMHSNNFASLIWDRIMWDGQQYRRFDYPSFFTETGTWAESANLSDWDDANYRYGITRYANGPASVQFTVPENAWQFNFIFRSDSVGTESATVTIAEGNGKMEAWNGSEWVEANGFIFSMRQVIVTLTDIEVRDPKTSSNMKTSVASYQVGGNTTYQKRLKMRCKSGTIDSRESTKTVTISTTTGRLLYWGVEWSPREYMITYVNAARGSHNMTFNSSLSLSHYQDNEVWSFNPDLIFTENPIHNSGGSGDGGMSAYRTTYWGYVTDDFFFKADNPISFAARATANGITGLEWVVFTSSLSWNFNGINDDGTLKLFEDKSGKVISALDAQEMCYQWIVDNKQDVISVNGCKYWCDAGKKLFNGDMKSATIGSGKNGSTFTNEGSHWNDTGCAVMDRCIGGVFDFYN